MDPTSAKNGRPPVAASSSLPPIPTPRSVSSQSPSSSRSPPPFATPIKVRQSVKAAAPRTNVAASLERSLNSNPGSPHQHSSAPQNEAAISSAINTTTTTTSDSALDSHLTVSDHARKISECLSDLSFHDAADDHHHYRSEHRDTEHAMQCSIVEGSASEYPSALLVSSPRHRASWHGVEGLAMGNSTTQANTSNFGRVRGPPRESVSTSPPAAPSSMSTPPTSSLSTHQDGGTVQNSSVTSAPHRSTITATPLKASAPAHTKKDVRRQHRLDSAQARRVVVAQQRHRKLFDLTTEEVVKSAKARGADALRTMSVPSAPSHEVMEEVSTGWMAALAAPPSSDMGGGELLSVASGGARAAASSAPPFPMSHSLGSPSPGQQQHLQQQQEREERDRVAGGSFHTMTSLTSLQNRLWQYTGPTAGSSAVVPNVHNKEHRERPAWLSSPLPLPPAREPPTLPSLQRTAAATLRHGRQGQYRTGLNHTELGADTVDARGASGYGATLALTTLPSSVPHKSLTPPPPPVPQWETSLVRERQRGRDGKEMAQWLVQRLLTSPGPMDLDRSRYASTTASMDAAYDTCGSGGDALIADVDDVRGGDLLRSLSERAAIAAYLLSHLVEAGLPRHQQSVMPYVRMLIEFAFVPDTPTIRAALGTGTVQDEDLIDRLAAYDHGAIPLAAATMTLPTAAATGSTGLRPQQLAGMPSTDLREVGPAMDLIDLLAPAFTRKTYITAHFEVSAITVGLAHEVRCRELHQRNVPRLLERTHKNWMRGLMRAVLRAWRHLCQERRVQEQRQRARWALRWTSERVRISLRRWRGYAALTLQMAEADTVAKAALAQKRAHIERLEKEAAAMQHSSEVLQETLQRQDEERESLEGTIAQHEVAYQRLLRQVREMDRVGSLMLNSLLLENAPPHFEDASTITALVSSPASRAASHRTSATGLSSSSSFGESGDDGDESESDGEAQQRLPHAVTALPSLLRWATDCTKAAEEVYCALYPPGSELKRITDPRGSGTGGESGRSASASLSHGGGGGGGGGGVLSRTASDSDSDAEAPLRAEVDFGSLLSSAAANTAGLADASTAETVLLPMYKLLLLMRGCSGMEEGAADGNPPPEDEATLSLEAQLEKKLAAEKDNEDGVSAAVAPSLGMIRTVQCADAAVLKEAYALLDKDSGMQDDHDGPFREQPSSPHPATTAAIAEAEETGADAPAGGLSLLLRLSPENRDNLQRICRVVVDAYEQLTGTACVVTAEQLFERSRGTLLVFLAALMRHYTNWMVRRAQQAQSSLMVTAAATTAAATAAAAATEPTLTTTASTSLGNSATQQPSDASDPAPVGGGGVVATKSKRAMNNAGVPHTRYDEWFHPPHSHQRWPGQVRRQAEWIALSFSAVHDAMRVATLRSRMLTVRQQDHVSGLLSQLSLTEFIDLLPNSPDQTMQCYVDMIGVVERYAPSLHLLFHQFALPLAQLRADEAAATATTATTKQRRLTRNDGAPNGSSGREVYVTANTVWYLLCMTGLAGDKSAAYCTAVSRECDGSATVSPPMSATLHRPAVFSLIEQVTQGGVESTAVSLRRSSTRQQNAIGAAETNADAAGSPTAAGATQAVVTVSCKTRARTCYARALREGRHVDLRHDTGAVCVNYTQFIKVLIRLAHAWQCQQQQQEALEQQQQQQQQHEAAGMTRSALAETACPTPAAASTTSAHDTFSRLKSKSVADAEAVGAPPNARSRATSMTTNGAASKRGSVLSAADSERSVHPSSSSVSAAVEAASTLHVAYEAGTYSHTLSLPYFDTFFGGLLLPRLLGSNRWIGAARRAMCSRPVLQVLARHHDDLLEVFNDYQRPREARGVRASLPPPYSTVLASQLFSRVVDAERQASSGLTVGGGRSMSHVQRASLMYSLNNSINRRISTDEAGLDDDGAMSGSKSNWQSKTPRRKSSFAKSKRTSLAASRSVLEEASTTENLRASVAAAQLRDVSIVSVLQWKDVMTLAKDMRWLTIRRLSEKALRQCFEHVCADVTREGDSVFFSEFLQLLCAVAYFATTNPAVPLEVKLEIFLQKYLFSPQD